MSTRLLNAKDYRTAAIITMTILAVAISYGALSQHAGFAPWQTALLALFALGGAAEITFVGVIAAGGAPLLALLAGLLINSRNFAFGLTVGGWIPQDWRSLPAAHFVNDESIAFSRTKRSQAARWQAFLLMGLLITIFWPGGAMLGQWLGAVVDADAFGFDAAFPIILFSLIGADLKHRSTLIAVFLGLVCTLLLTPILPVGLGPVSALLALIPVGAVVWWRKYNAGIKHRKGHTRAKGDGIGHVKHQLASHEEHSSRGAS